MSIWCLVASSRVARASLVPPPIGGGSGEGTSNKLECSSIMKVRLQMINFVFVIVTVMEMEEEKEGGPNPFVSWYCPNGLFVQRVRTR